MTALPPCPKCCSEYAYVEEDLFMCPDCLHEWQKEEVKALVDAVRVIKDAHGAELNDGDTITVTRDLKVKGSSLVIKVGTKIKNIRLVEGDHDIDCKVEGVGAMKLKSEFVRKV